MISFWVVYFFIGLLYTLFSMYAEPLSAGEREPKWSNLYARVAEKEGKLRKIGKVALRIVYLLIILMLDIFMRPLVLLYLASHWLTTKINRRHD